MTRREFEVTDINKIKEILDKAKVLHLGLIDDGKPYVLAMNYGYEMNGEKLYVYLHSSVRGYKIDVIKKNPDCCFEMDCDITPFEGEVACKYGVAYKSIIGRGKINIVEDVEEKKHIMSVLMDTQTGKNFEFDDKLVKVVSVLKIDVTEYTAKERPLPKR